MTKIQFTALVFALAIGWLILLIVRGVDVSMAMVLPLSSVAGVGFTLIQLFDRYLWKWGPLHPWFVQQPVIEGTWLGIIRSDYVDPATNQRVPPIRVYFRIRQTYSSIHLRLMTAESSSDLLSGKLSGHENGTFAVAGIYLNTPRADLQDRSRIHHGGLLLRIHGDPGVRLEGNYWTDRKTTGSMAFDQRVGTLYASFADAERAFADLAKAT